MPAPIHPDLRIAHLIDETYDDPLTFVELAYPWNESGGLHGFKGPDLWQRAFLEDLGRQVRTRGFDGVHAVAPIRMATASGHGIGKSTLVAWVVNWNMSTRPHCQGTVTANIYTQLETRTWAAIRKWTRLCVTGYWFVATGNRLAHRQSPQTWFVSAQSCREENSEAFAGQHAANSTSFYVFDEASSIPDKIFEVAEGGLTDGEPMIFGFGNPTRASGKFHRVAFGSERDRWDHRSIDSRTCALPNKRQIEEWIADYGEDSDFVRVRVRGLPPSSGDMQFIDSERIWEAQRRPPQCLPDDPLICGVDVARGGGDWNVIRFRKGLDARTIPPVRIPGEQTRDSMTLVPKLSDLLSDKRQDRKIAHMFVDAGPRRTDRQSPASTGVHERFRDQLRPALA